MKKIPYIFIFLLLGFQACTDHYEELNTNPAGFSELDPGLQLAKVQADLSGEREDAWYVDLGIVSPMVQHIGGSWWSQHGSQYKVAQKNHWYTLWESTYPRDLKNIQDIIDRTADQPEMVNIHSAARIMRVYIFSRLTDVYGDIPYSQAIKGYNEGILLPKYDKQADIYADFFLELDDAVKAFSESEKAITGDLFFSGNTSQWKKFGNSLRLRLGMRLTKVNEAEAKKQVEAALAAGVMESNDDIAMLRHMNVSFNNKGENRGNGRSQVFRATVNSENYRLAGALVEHLKETNDPRLTIYGGTYLEDGTDITAHLQQGLTNGAFTWDLWTDHGPLFDSNNEPVLANPEDPNSQIFVGHNFKLMQPSKYISALDAPFFHLTYAEVEFLKAEAALRNWAGAGNAEQHFKAGVKAGCEMMQFYPAAPAISEEKVQKLLESYKPFPATFEGGMEVVHEQMWVNFFMNGLEAYANYRRTGYPELEVFTSLGGVNSETGGVMPRRFFYPEAEALQNLTNYEEAVSRLGGQNDWLQRVWWDVK